MAFDNILITGGGGLIGSNLALRLAGEGRRVTILGRNSRLAIPDLTKNAAADKIEVVAGDPTDKELMVELVQQADAVYHKTSSIGMTGAVESAHDYVGANMSTTATLIDCLRTPGVKTKKVILGSSVSVYGEGNYHCAKCGAVRPELRVIRHPAPNAVSWNPPCPTCGRQVEPMLTPESASRNGESIYAVTKKAQEDLLIGSCRQLGLPLSVLRYGTVLGPGQSWHNPFTRVLELLGAGEQPVVHEDGMQTRDFIFIDDVIEVNVRSLERQNDLIDRLNVSAVQLPLLDFIKTMSESMSSALNRKPVEPIVDGKLIAGDVRHCWIDCSRLHESYGVTPSMDLKRGMQQLVEWFVKFKGLAGATK